MLPSKSIDAGNPSRFSGLDLLRSMAIILVVIRHMPVSLFPESLVPMKQMGWIGVDLFFVLSGYLIGLQLLRPYSRGSKPSFAVFYSRRLLRVMPAFLVVLALYFIVPSFRELPDLPPLWRFLTFTQNFGLDFSLTGAFSHAWSLCVEEHFYLLLPVIAACLMWKPRFSKSCAFVAGVALAGAALRYYLWLEYVRPAGAELASSLFWKELYYPTYCRLDGLMVGVVIAALKFFRPQWWLRITSRGNSLWLASCLMLAAATWVWRYTTSWSACVLGQPLLAVGFGLLVIASLSPGCILCRFRAPGATMLATLAYSTYLTHKAVMHLDARFLDVLGLDNVVFKLAVYIVTMILAAAILHLAVERPFLQLREKIGLRDKGQSYLTPAATLAAGRSLAN